MDHPATPPDWLSADEAWLTAQPGMAPWPAAAACVVAHLAAWAARYAADLGLTAGPPADAPRALWECWRHHWRTAADEAERPVDGWVVAGEIESGVGRRGRGQLGGNVVRDVVLARAMLARDNAAVRRFEADYRGSIVRQVAAVRRYARDDLAWWNDLLAELVGVHREGRAGRLARYNGRSGLVPWVVTVGIRFLCDWKADRPTGTEIVVEPAAPGGNTGPDLGMLSGECMDLLTRRVRAALAALVPRHRLALKMAYLDGLSGQQIAAVLRIHPGNVTRLRQDALKNLNTHLAATAEDGEAIGDCLRDLFLGGHRRDLAESLFAALRTTGPEGGS